MGTLRVRSIEQKVLWDFELAGQISDGCWENATPNNHWKPWTSATVVVDPGNPGRDFYAQRTAYGFARQDNLLYIDCIRDRMLDAVRVATGRTDYDLKALKADLRDLQAIIKLRVQPIVTVPPQLKGVMVLATIDGYEQRFETYDPACPLPLAPTDEQLARKDAINAILELGRVVEVPVGTIDAVLAEEGLDGLRKFTRELRDAKRALDAATKQIEAAKSKLEAARERFAVSV